MSDTLGTAAVGRGHRGALQAGDAAHAASPAPRPRKRRGRGRLRLEIALLSGPAIIVFVGLVIYPVVLGSGRRLFGEISANKLMRLVGNETVDDLAFLTYEPVRDA